MICFSSQKKSSKSFNVAFLLHLAGPSVFYLLLLFPFTTQLQGAFPFLFLFFSPLKQSVLNYPLLVTLDPSKHTYSEVSLSRSCALSGHH